MLLGAVVRASAGRLGDDPGGPGLFARCDNFTFLKLDEVHPWSLWLSRSTRNKKTDVAEHPKAFDHVGLLVNKPPGKAELLFI